MLSFRHVIKVRFSHCGTCSWVSSFRQRSNEINTCCFGLVHSRKERKNSIKIKQHIWRIMRLALSCCSYGLNRFTGLSKISSMEHPFDCLGVWKVIGRTGTMLGLISEIYYLKCEPLNLHRIPIEWWSNVTSSVYHYHGDHDAILRLQPPCFWRHVQWNLSTTTTSIIKYITCDLFNNVF